MAQAKILSHEERLEITRRKMAFREMVKHMHETPAAPGVEEFEETHSRAEYECPACGAEMLRFEGCWRCPKCGTSLC